ncbi:MAG: hypothetical protein IPP17_19380 [Bacteroidetes bacterium]|nr:hypothetical protein [Bacteroidota bacterium]
MGGVSKADYLAIRAGRNASIEHAYLQHLYAYQEDTLVEIAGEQQTVLSSAWTAMADSLCSKAEAVFFTP